MSSAKRGTATLLLLHAWLYAQRARRAGLVAIAVTSSSRKLFASLGFSHFREAYWLPLHELSFERVHARLQHDDVLIPLCWRRGLTAGSAANVVGRC